MKPAGCGVIAGGVLIAIAALLWMAEIATLSDLSGSDAAGNGMSLAFGDLEVIILWLLMAILVVMAAVIGSLPMPAVFPGVVLVPASGAAALHAAELLRGAQSPPYLWPIIVPALVPPLFLLFVLWPVAPPLRRAVPAWFVPGLVWGGALGLCLALWPMTVTRDIVVARSRAQYEAWGTDFGKLPKDAPLWEWVPFFDTPSDVRQGQVIKGIQALERRQADAETMLDRGDFPLSRIGEFDLRPTPEICDKTRALLRRRLALLVLKPGETRPYADIREPVAGAVAAMEWLTGYGCSCDAEALAWQNMANAYDKPEYDVYRLRDVQDPKKLGETLRESPAHFDMLTPDAHLRAWLKFAGDPSSREKALAGARGLTHRTEDAVDILHGDEYEAWDLLIDLPELDLQATPELCGAALQEVRRELGKIYRPAPNDPRSYQELEQRMGTGKPLQALIWLVRHDCDTGGAVGEAVSLVGSYQDSPERAAMMAALERMR